MCLYPKLIQNKKYTANKKNGGRIPEMKDKRVQWVAVGCGRCMECLEMKGREWRVRLHEEYKSNRECEFVTLTYSEDSLIELDNAVEDKKIDGWIRENEIARISVRRFLERWRKENKKSVRHWLITEKGGENGRIHLHGLIWSKDREMIKKHWKYGIVGFGEWINEATINYITKYVMKQDPEHKDYEPKIFTSAGIGKNYLKRSDAKRNRYNGKETREFYLLNNGAKIGLPIYYRNNIYSEEEREQLWLNKLDKQVRYVKGEKIDISENEDEYEEVLDYYQKKNKRLGYGDDKINWEKRNYAERRKKLRLEKQRKKELQMSEENIYLYDELINNLIEKGG